MANADIPIFHVTQDQLRGPKTWRDQAPDFQLVTEGLKQSGLIQSEWGLGPESSPVVVDFRGVNELDYTVWIQGEEHPLKFKLLTNEKLLDKLKSSDVESKLRIQEFDGITEQRINFPLETNVGENSNSAVLNIENGNSCFVLVGSKKIDLGDVELQPSRSQTLFSRT